MTDEFDDPIDDAYWHRIDPKRRRRGRAVNRARASAARLMSRLYAAAGAPLRARMLAALLRPLGPLGLVGIAAGAFAGFVRRGGTDGVRVAVDEVGRYTSEHVYELAHFVEQISPEALQQAASLVAENPGSIAAFSVSVALLLLRSLRDRSADATLPSAGETRLR